jgi:hypothetical protein
MRVLAVVVVILVGCGDGGGGEQAAGLAPAEGWCGVEGEPCTSELDGGWAGTCRHGAWWECCGGCWDGEARACRSGVDAYGCGQGGDVCQACP